MKNSRPSSLIVFFSVALCLAVTWLARFEWLGWRGLSSSFSRIGPNVSFEEWLVLETERSIRGLQDNIAPGTKAKGDVVSGTVLASPSQSHPDYYYQWTRDSALVMSFFTRNLAQIGGSDPFLEGYLDRYVALQQKLQRLDNPSGGFGDLSGLGEPKFLANGKAFTADWGRPQRDGPALRALTCIAYLRAYNASHSELWASTSPHGQADWYKGFYESTLPATSLIKADLEYVAKYWDTTGFDIWEEVDGLHFFTAMVQRRALREGADIAARFGDSGAASWYIQQQNDILNRLKMFWDSYHGRLMASVGTLRSGLDCANLLGAIHGETDDTDKYPPWSDEVLLGLLDLVEDQRSRFKINASPGRKAKALEGVVIGRYPEDIYDGDGFSGGNPWFLCTIAVSEVLFKAATRFRDQGRLTVTESGVRFWKALTGSDVKGEVTGSALENCTRALVAAGDSFLAAMRRYVDNEGGMSEQIDGKSGAQTGARDLTWSYSAFLSAIDARNAALGKN